MKKILIIGLLLVLCFIVVPALAATDPDWYTIKDWSGKNGKGLIQETDLQRLRGFNLTEATGAAFEPVAWPDGYTQLKAWLFSSQTSSNMAYQLSAQLAVSDLNINIRNVDATTLIYAPGTTSADASGYAMLQSVMEEADIELGLHPITGPGNPNREYQETLRNALDNTDDPLSADQVVISGIIAETTPSMIYCWGDPGEPAWELLKNRSELDYITINAGHYHNLALHSNGSIQAWGYDDWDQVSAKPIDSGYDAISAGFSHSVAIKDGSIVDWGDTESGVIDGTPTAKDFSKIDASTFHSLALDNDGNVEAWGVDIWGQASNPPDLNYIDIAAGEQFSLALLSDHTIYAWGNPESPAVIERPTDGGYTAIAAGYAHALALRSDGKSINAWGWNAWGQADDPPVLPEGDDVTYVAIAAGQDHSIALRSDGTLYVWGPETSLAVLNTPDNNGFVDVAAGYFHNIALNPLDITPPASVTSLQNTTNTNSSITWTWINPPDTDFDHVDIYLNGTLVDSVGSGGQSYTAPGLMTNTEYILGTRTVDTSGTINSTMVTDSAWTAPDAQFSASPTSGVAPLTVQFTDESPGSGILTYEWDFDNDGSVDGEEQNPSMDFDEGTYTVKLAVTGPGGSDEEIKTGYILVTSTPTAPVAQFSATPISGLIPLTVQFTDSSTGSGPLTYYWDFQDNGIIDSNEQNPSFTYTSVGNYTVNLTVSNLGGPDSEVKQNFVFAFIPVQGYTKAPTDPDNDGRFEDLTGNGQFTYVDINVFYNNFNWVKLNEPVYSFDFSGNGGITYVDVTVLFHHPLITV